MKTIVLISCASKKRRYKSMARDLYQSSLFKLALKYAEKIDVDDIYILSALHGVLKLDELIEPYNVTLNDMSEKDKKVWAKKVMLQLSEKDINFYEDKIIFLAGNNYRKYIVSNINNVEIPMERLRIGEQLAFLKGKVNNE